MATVSVSERMVTAARAKSIISSSMGAGFRVPFLPQPKLHRDLDEHVNRLSQALRRRESPLPHCADGFLIQTHAEAIDHAYLSHGAIVAGDDLQDDVAFESGPASLFCIARSYLSQEAWRLDAASRPVGSPARSSA
jgi:hypothetical protein